MGDEDDLRAALRTLERHTPDPDRMLATIRAAGERRGTAAPPRPGTRWHGPADRAARWSRRMAPLAVAAAVLVTIAAAGVVAKVVAPGPAGPGPALRVSTAAPPFPTWDGLPAYFIANPGPFDGGEPSGTNAGGSPASQLPAAQDLPIIATSTGRAVATVRLPGYVAAISASAGAFFAAVVKDNAAYFYEVRLPHGGTRATATKLPIPADTAPIGFIAASPDGRKLAISTLVQHGSASDIQNLVVAATSTGTERRWYTPATDAQGSMGTMAWLADGKTLAFNWTGPAAVSPSTGLRLLDTSAPGDNLLSGAFMLRGYNRAGSFDDYAISPDGRMLLGVVSCLPGCGPGSLGTVQGHPDLLGSLIQFGAATKAPAVRYAEPELPGVAASSGNSGCIDPMWLSASGRKILLPCFQHRPGTRGHKGATLTHVFLLDGGKATALTWLSGFVNGEAAFPGITFMGGGWVGPPPGYPYPSS
jgi:WD40-like Beta Propeller Repeat